MNKYITILAFSSIVLAFEKIGFISDVEGYVEIISKKDDTSKVEVEALQGRYIYENDIVKSYPDSYCTIIFEDRSTLLSIAEESEIYFSNIDEKIKKIKINYGELYIENKSKLEPVFIFTNFSQIYSLNSALFINSLADGRDDIYTILNAVDIYNKKSKISLRVEPESKASSYKKGDIELKKREDSFLPFKIKESIRRNSEVLITPIKELKLSKGDLFPNYDSDYRIDVYGMKKNKKNIIGLNSSLCYLNKNPYSKIAVNSKYIGKNIYLDLELDYYVPIQDSPNINSWDSSFKILAKIKELSYFKEEKMFKIKSGSINNLTIGQGLLVKNYRNHLNYPFNSSYGIDISYNNRDFFSLHFFSSNLENLIEGEGFAGLYNSIFISKYMPLKLGFGIILDMNQFAMLDDQYLLSSRKIKSFQFDSAYDLYDKKGYDVNFVSELAAIIFPDTHYYKRYNSSNDLSGGLKKKSGTWGGAVGVQGAYSHFFKIKSLFHYNDPLFTPSFFNSTYDFERYRLLSQRDSYSGNISQIDEMFSDFEYLDDFLIVPKDLYLSYTGEEMVYSSSGITLDVAYNYYDKILADFSYSAFFEIGNPSGGNNFSSLNLEFQIRDRVIKNIEGIGFYYSKNISDKVLDIVERNENSIIGLSIQSKIKFNLLFDFNFERSNYDYDFDGKTDYIDIIELGLIYRI